MGGGGGEVELDELLTAGRRRRRGNAEGRLAAGSPKGRYRKEQKEGALVRNPPAPFLTRTSTHESTGFKVRNDRGEPIPKGAHLILALGAAADPAYIFGGSDPSDYSHHCIGQHLAWPLTLETVGRG